MRSDVRAAGRSIEYATRRVLGTCAIFALVLQSGAWTASGVEESNEGTKYERPASALDSPIEINRKVTDPVSTTWSLKLLNNVIFQDVGSHGDHAHYKLQFQPTMPLLLTPSWKLITRPEFTLVDDTPYTDSQGALRRTTGVGDTILDVVVSPELRPWLLALGPTFVFPTANLDQTGQGKWQAGPAGVVGYRAKQWMVATIFQQWWSFAGASSRPAVTELHAQYIATYFFADGWSIGTSPTVKVDWRATSGNQLTFPIGPTVGKVVTLGGVLPMKFEIEGLYVPIYSDPNGERFVVEFKLIPVIPAPLQRPVSES